MIEIPLIDTPEQSFNMPLGRVNYKFVFMLNSRTELYSMSIYTSSNEAIVEGVYLTSGQDILRPYNLALSNMIVINLEEPNRDPYKERLGTSSKLILLEESDLNV